MPDWKLEYHKLRSVILRFIQTGEGNFSELALEVYRFQFTRNAVYQRFCKMRGVELDLAEWKDIPAVPQQAFKMSRLTVFPIEDDVCEFRTSGTTGEGFGSHFFCDLTLYNAAIEAGWKQLNFPKVRKFALASSPTETPYSSLSYMLGKLDCEKFYLQNGKLQEELLRMDLEALKEPVILLGTALAFLNLMEKTDGSLPLPNGSFLLETGGYKGSSRVLTKAAFYEQLARFFAIDESAIINEYGMTELSSQYYSHGIGNIHLSGTWMRHRIVNPLTGKNASLGEPGVLQLFDLANLGSVLAIQTEDLAIQTSEGFVLLGRDPSAIERGCSRSVDDLLNQ